MGAANLKGKTFEERKAKAIEGGRIKTGPRKTINRIMREYEAELMASMMTLNGNESRNEIISKYLDFERELEK